MIQAISIFSASFFSFVLALYVGKSNPRSPVNLFFMALVFLNGLYSLLLGLFLSITSLHGSHFFPRLLYAVPALIPPSFYLFCRVFPDPPTKEAISASLKFHIPLATAMVALSLSEAIHRGSTITDMGIRPIYGPLFTVYIAYFLAYMLASAVTLTRKYFMSKGLSRIQVRYAFLGLVPSFVAVIAVTLVLPSIGVRQFSQIGPVFTIPMVGIIGYAILRHRLMDVTLVVRELVILFLFLSITVGLIILLAACFLDRYVLPVNRGSFLAEIGLIGVLVCLLAYRLDKIIALVVDVLLFRGRYDYKASLKLLSGELSRLTEIEQMLSTLSQRIRRLFNLKRVVVVFRWNNSQSEFACLAAPGNANCFSEGILNEVIELLSVTGEVIVEEEFRRSPVSCSLRRELELFGELGCTVFVGLRGKVGFVGFLGLGEKTSGDVFSKDDLSFLATVANQTVVALENCRLYSELLAIKEYTERVLEQLTCGVVTVDNSGAVTAMNAKAFTVLGIKRGNQGLGTVAELPQEIAEAIGTTLRSRTAASNLEIRLEIEGQPTQFLNLSTTPLRDPKGDVIGALAVLTDLTEIKQLEAEVRRVERLATVGTLAAGMAHEIKNPLVSLKTFAQLLPGKYDDPEFRESFSKIASDEIERINSLVEQLLRFARPPKPIPMPIDLHEPVEQTLALLGTETAKKGIRLTTRFPEKPLLVFADSEQLKQVFMNVLLNALEALSLQEEPSLEISTGIRRRWGWPLTPPFAKLPEGYSQGDREAYVRIADNGPGIRENHIKHIFDPFFTTKETGHGLGLSIAHGIVREHKGSINAENRPGGGAVFTIALPLLESEVATRSGDAHELRADRLA